MTRREKLHLEGFLPYRLSVLVQYREFRHRGGLFRQLRPVDP